MENPLVAAALGLVLAYVLLAASRASFRVVTPEASAAGLGLAALSLLARLGLVVLALWAYKHFVGSGFKPFAFTLAGGFLVLYTVELVRYAGVLKRRRPADARS